MSQEAITALESADDLDELKQYLVGFLEAESRRRRQLEDRVDELESIVESLEPLVEEHHDELAQLTDTYRTLAGVAGPEETTHQARKRDLVIALENLAKERANGMWAMDYNDIKDELAARGHGSIADQQAYRLIDEIADEVRGCYTGDHPDNGNQAIKIDLDRFDQESLAADAAANDVRNSVDGRASSDQHQPTQPTGDMTT